MAVQNSGNHNFQSDGGNTRNFDEHIRRMRAFRESYANALEAEAARCGTLEEHNKHMKAFRRSHTVLEVGTRKLNKYALIEGVPLLQVSRPVSETGGSRGVIGQSAWSALIPMWRVELHRVSPN